MMRSVLGIDAAWTANQPSGVALVQKDPAGRWEFVELAPSYDAFIALAAGIPVRWDEKPKGTRPEPEPLLRAAEQLLGGGRVTAISVDMPMAKVPITKRRASDSAVSQKFGSKGCGVHSPSSYRPGAISDQMLKPLVALGYNLAVSEDCKRGASIIEVYPHTALLNLLNRDFRVPYKVGNSLKFWPGTSANERADRLISKFKYIHAGLTGVIQGIPDFLPMAPYRGSLASLKRYEDALDALICAWVGTRYLDGHAVPYGDDTAAIWVPE